MKWCEANDIDYVTLPSAWPMLIKLHKTQLASDRRAANYALCAPHRRLWLMLTVRDAIPRLRDLATAGRALVLRTSEGADVPSPALLFQRVPDQYGRV